MDPNKLIKYQHYQLTDKVNFGGLMDVEQCKALSQKILSIYDGNGKGFVDTFELGYMLSDVYRAMNKGFNPTPTDLASYTRVVDSQGNGRVSQLDLEKLCIKYFAGQSGGVDAKNENSSAKLSDLKSRASQDFGRQISSPQLQSQGSFFKQSVLTSQQSQSNMNQNQQGVTSMSFQYQQPVSTTENYQSSYQTRQQVRETQNASTTQNTQTTLKTTVQKTIVMQNAIAEMQQQKKLTRRLSQVARQRLDVATRIFRKIDEDNSGFITEEEVPLLLKETYAQMGINFEPTQEDIELWMQMTDTNQDKQVSLEEFEELVLRSLEKQGISLE